jgi:hypothetical protein
LNARIERNIRRALTVETRRQAGGNPAPRWRWAVFQALLWVAWRVRWRWVTRLAGLACLIRWMGWDYEGAVNPIRWPSWLVKEEVPF